MALFSANVCRGSECAPSRHSGVGVNIRVICKDYARKNKMEWNVRSSGVGGFTVTPQTVMSCWYKSRGAREAFVAGNLELIVDSTLWVCSWFVSPSWGKMCVLEVKLSWVYETQVDRSEHMVVILPSCYFAWQKVTSSTQSFSLCLQKQHSREIKSLI